MSAPCHRPGSIQLETSYRHICADLSIRYCLILLILTRGCDRGYAERRTVPSEANLTIEETHLECNSADHSTLGVMSINMSTSDEQQELHKLSCGPYTYCWELEFTLV
jgi:hypothetical protein